MNAAMNGFLVSFCNTGMAQGRRSLAVVDLTGASWFVDLPDNPIFDETIGATGLCRVGDEILVAFQGAPYILRLGPRLGVKTHFHVDGSDLHGLAALNNQLAIVSTGDDRVLIGKSDDPSGVASGRQASPRSDTMHFNDVAYWCDELVVSGFGERRPNGLRSGGVWRVRDMKPILDGMREPHSVVSIENRLFVLESKTGELIEIDNDGAHRVIAQFAGYVRGLAVTAEHIAVGRSAFRAESRSKSEARRQPPFDSRPEQDAEHAKCGIYIGDRAARQFKFVDLSPIGAEVYAILPIDLSGVRKELLIPASHEERIRFLTNMVDRLKARLAAAEKASQRAP